jgi:hypothetical protein
MVGLAHANAFVFIALACFVPLAFLVFRLMPAPLAATVLLIGGEMFLPADGGIDLPGLPVLGRDQIIYTSVLLCMIVFHGRQVAAARPGTSLELLAVVIALGGLGTVLTNPDRLVYGATQLPGITPGEAPTAMLSDVLRYGAPFLLGRMLHRDQRDLHRLFSVLAIAGIVYSLFGFVEMWLSPQFHNWVYGFIPFGANTTWRLGGYRPMVFMRNGLAYAIFMATTLLAATALAKAQLPVLSLPSRSVAAYLFAMVIASRSLAVMVWSVIFTPIAYLARPRFVATVALAMALAVSFYPLLRIADLVSWKPVTDIAASFDADRARSLEGRFKVEGAMLDKARERFLFGWGGHTRHFVYDERGEKPLVPDGHWILQLGSRGVVGFAGDFGLSLIPIVIAWRRLGRVRGRAERILLAGLMLMIGLRMVDMIPNGRWTSLPLFLAGALHSCSWAMAHARVAASAAAPSPEVAAPTEDVSVVPAPRPPRLSDTLRRRPRDAQG